MTYSTAAANISADARQAGKFIVHTVHVDGVPVGKRRSERRYAFAICKWTTFGMTGETTRVVVVRRWSNSPKTTGMEFAVPVGEWTPKTPNEARDERAEV